MGIKIDKESMKIHGEELNKLEDQTKDKFTKKLIEDLKKQIKSNEPEFLKHLNFRRILGLIDHEIKGNKLSEFKKNKYKHLTYGLRVSLRDKKRDLLLNGDMSLSHLSEIIQKEFDLEPMHLYEFKIGDYKFGPECEEWQEMFDSLDDFRIGAAISATGLNKGDKFRFLYDFGSNILFKIEIMEIKKLNFNI